MKSRKRYILAWANELFKLVLVIAVTTATWGLWIMPVSNNERMLGVVIGILVLLNLFFLADLTYGLIAIARGKHKILHGEEKASK